MSGTKPGRIAYIGETQFAPGEWAGVVLDEAVGKNDGSVSGVRYFQCEAKRGVFSRVSKLSYTPLEVSNSAGSLPPPPPSQQQQQKQSATANASLSASAIAQQTPSKNGAAPDRGDVTSISSVTPSAGGAAARGAHSTPAGARSLTSAARNKHGLNASQSSLNQESSNTTMSTSVTSQSQDAVSAPAAHNLRVNDRVIVSGSKQGVLRYVGTTEFAAGEWAGVELAEPQGKNDGTVAGKR